MSLFQSNLRKQIRKLPKILQFVKIIHYYCELFTSLLSAAARARDGFRELDVHRVGALRRDRGVPVSLNQGTCWMINIQRRKAIYV